MPSCYLLSCNTDIHGQWVGSFLGNTQNSTKISVQSTCKGAAWKARCPAGGSTRSGVVVAVMYKVRGEKRTGGLGGFVAFEISGNGGVGGSGINIKSQILRALHGVIHIHPPYSSNSPAVSLAISHLTLAYLVPRHIGFL